VGCVLAAYVVETVGPQDYTFTAQQFLDRLDHSYGGDAAEAIRPFLS
jgi:adenosine kinase